MSATHRLRIIGGQWRGRKFDFPEVEGLRPTPDRVRETLFNWLQGLTEGTRCLDLFAGSGALGFEALSRGAGQLTLVEHDAQAVNQLRANALLMRTQHCTVVQDDVLRYLKRGPGQESAFDLIFLDPPYYQKLIEPCCELLEQQQWLSPHAYIYIEAERALSHFALPRGWELTRSKNAGQVGYHLAIRRAGARDQAGS